MIKIFIEAQNESTPEYNFISTLLNTLGVDSRSYKIEPLAGKDNLQNAKNQFIQNTLEGGTNLMVFDADYENNGGGYEKRKQEIMFQLKNLGIKSELFLWPDNCNDGDFELMLEGIARKDAHKRFFECFNDYEMCLGDEYLHPNRKGKLYTYITAMKMSNKQRKKIGSGKWLFEDSNYWDLDSELLKPLKEFIMSCKF